MSCSISRQKSQKFYVFRINVENNFLLQEMMGGGGGGGVGGWTCARLAPPSFLYSPGIVPSFILIIPFDF